TPDGYGIRRFYVGSACTVPGLSALQWGFGFPECGPVAQLGARLNGIQEVTGSIPVRSTILRSRFARATDGVHRSGVAAKVDCSDDPYPSDASVSPGPRLVHRSGEAAEVEGGLCDSADRSSRRIRVPSSLVV